MICLQKNLQITYKNIFGFKYVNVSVYARVSIALILLMIYASTSWTIHLFLAKIPIISLCLSTYVCASPSLLLLFRYRKRVREVRRLCPSVMIRVIGHSKVERTARQQIRMLHIVFGVRLSVQM